MTPDLRAARATTRRRRDPTERITWLRYIWIAAAITLGAAGVSFGVVVGLYVPVACESNCGTAWPWAAAFLVLGAIIVLAAIRDAVRTVRWNRGATRSAPETGEGR